jgi:hypothetical protein
MQTNPLKMEQGNAPAELLDHIAKMEASTKGKGLLDIASNDLAELYRLARSLREPATRFCLVSPTGLFCSYDMKRGAYLTDNPALRYVWNTPEEASRQRPAYEYVLHCAIEVKEAR